MHKSNEDCFYFLTSSCAKGVSCTYRHSPLALASNVICPLWTRGNCLDPACPHRHTTSSQRPSVGNGILCFYENTPMGCLKPDCTFVHSRPRMHLRNTSAIRPSATILINKDASKPIITKTSSSDTLQTTQVVSVESSQSETIVPNTTTESPSVVKPEIVTRRITVSPTNEQKPELKPSSDDNNNHLSPIKCMTRSVITDSPKLDQDVIPQIQTRIIINRNVVMAEPNNTTISNRKIVQTKTPSSTSTRVVVSSEAVHSSKEKRNDMDLSEQENNTKKFKSNSQSIIDISFPCSTPTIIDRLSCVSSKETTFINNTKPIQLNRNRLPTSKISNANSSISISKPTGEDKLSAGTFVGITFIIISTYIYIYIFLPTLFSLLYNYQTVCSMMHNSSYTNSSLFPFLYRLCIMYFV
ncbi:hypothetical protein I4U23_028241 [Adineta vaga]|nr:hypothetical protein I4U23_028241 [Adineta vaga]